MITRIYFIILTVSTVATIISTSHELHPLVEIVKSSCEKNKNLAFTFIDNGILSFKSLDLGFLCSSTFSDVVPVSPSMTYEVSRIYEMNDGYCDYSDQLDDEHHFELLQKRELYQNKRSHDSDILRSKSLSCLNIEFNVSESSLNTPSGYVLSSESMKIYSMNSIDYTLGYINPKLMNLISDLEYYNHFPLVISSLIIGKFDEIKPLNSTDYLSTSAVSELERLMNKVSRELTTDELVYGRRNINLEILILDNLIGKLECDSVLRFNHVIKEIANLHLSIRIYQGGILKNDYFRLRYSPIYFPNHNNHDETLLWLALRGSSFNIRVKYYLKLLNHDNITHSDQFMKLDNLLISMYLRLVNKFRNYHNLYLETHMVLKTYLTNDSDQISILNGFTNSNLCL